MWDTEWAYSSTWYGDGHAAESRHRQAVFASREMLTSWALGFPIAVYYDVRDDGTDPAEKEHNFGLLANDYTDKPSMVALRTLSSIAVGRALSAFGLATPTTLQSMRWRTSTDPWMGQGARRQRIVAYRTAQPLVQARARRSHRKTTAGVAAVPRAGVTGRGGS